MREPEVHNAVQDNNRCAESSITALICVSEHETKWMLLEELNLTPDCVSCFSMLCIHQRLGNLFPKLLTGHLMLACNFIFYLLALELVKQHSMTSFLCNFESNVDVSLFLCTERRLCELQHAAVCGVQGQTSCAAKNTICTHGVVMKPKVY